MGLVSLGCPKALVDSERIVSRLVAEGYVFSPTYEGADAVIVNTCGFLDSARAESLEAIGEALAENGKVIVTGCMGATPELITGEHKGILAITGPQDYEGVVSAVHKAAPPPSHPFTDLVPGAGVRLTPRHYAYLKISEGCNIRCSFCIIPALRGDLASRPVDDVLREAERLAKAGVKEILVISQDTSAYGLDLRYPKAEWRGETYETRFSGLAAGLGRLADEHDIWVRMHYVYPYPHVDGVVARMAEGGGVLPYLDIPFQHASPSVLKAMRRPANQEKTADRIAEWRRLCPDLTIRSTFIAGFPGETEADFEFLLDWLREVRLDRVGCFAFEPVDGATANELPGALPEEVREERRARLMAVQAEISAEKLQARIGTRQRVLVDSVEDGMAGARTRYDAPEIDGVVHIEGAGDLKPGDFATVDIVDADDHDLDGVLVR
ncbi:MAG: 30S ribosomal protein S12 methylthiotransferase RimO [Alphaproteobacteria bacterium]|nr:30S ribosomal protein S12 methylthiotransferase RimO [Alphaproteobacteria bacterium]